jgi:hypothetical protein
VRTDAQVVRVGVDEVDKQVLNPLRNLRSLDNAVHQVLGCEDFVDVGAVHGPLDVLERWLDVFCKEFLPVNSESERLLLH